MQQVTFICLSLQHIWKIWGDTKQAVAAVSVEPTALNSDPNLPYQQRKWLTRIKLYYICKTASYSFSCCNYIYLVIVKVYVLILLLHFIIHEEVV